MPTAVPMMAASASGLSITRCEPNLRWRSSVTRKTPPSTPTSSPRSRTSGSRSISWRSAQLRAFTMLSLVIACAVIAASGADRASASRAAGSLARPAAIARLARDRVDREDVVAVHLDPRQAVGERLLGDRLRVALLLERHRDRPLVVLADEHDRHVPDPREVQGLVEVALAGGTVAEVCHDDRVVAAVLGRVGQAYRVGELRRDGDRDGQVVLVGRRLAAFDVSGEEEQDLLDRPAAPDHRRRLAERRDHPVGPPQREHAPQLGGLLALDRRERPAAALALQADHELLEATPEHHRAVEGLQVTGGELRVERGVQVALAVENRQVFDLEPRLEDGSGHDRSSTLILPLADNRRIINGGPKIPPTGGQRWRTLRGGGS